MAGMSSEVSRPRGLGAMGAWCDACLWMAIAGGIAVLPGAYGFLVAISMLSVGLTILAVRVALPRFDQLARPA
jgi:hypothetical protein